MSDPTDHVMTADQRLVYDSMRESLSRTGLTTDAIRRKLRVNRDGYWRIKQALSELCDLGLMEWTKGEGHSRLYSVAGACRLPGVGQNDQRVDLHETPAMARSLENLFALTPHRHDHGDVIQLERGKVPMRPATLVPTQVPGAW